LSNFLFFCLHFSPIVVAAAGNASSRPAALSPLHPTATTKAYPEISRNLAKSSRIIARFFARKAMDIWEIPPAPGAVWWGEIRSEILACSAKFR
jgi:hypothetical protein